MQRGWVSIVLVVLLAVGAATQSASAASSPGAPASGSSLQQLRDQLAESSDAMVAAATALHRAKEALPAARRNAARFRAMLAAAQQREEAAAHSTGVAQTKLMLASQTTEQTASMVQEQRARIARVARAVYQRGGPVADMSMLLESQSPADFSERLVALQSVMSSQRSALSDLEEVTSSYDSQAVGLEQVRDELAAAHEKTERELATIADLAGRAAAAEQQVRQLVADQAGAYAAARAARAEDERQLAEQHTESSHLQSMLAAQLRALGMGGVGGSTVPVQPGVLTFPVIGPVTSPFGMRVHPITGVRKLHTGTDFGVACGTPIKAARSGTVLIAEFNRAYGWRTVISHGVVGGVLLTTTYNHQVALGVTAGQTVTTGEVIGHVGTTGYSTGCHLHFELLVNSDLVDPLPWLLAG